MREINLILNETRYEDLGVSGWTGKNIERGRLGELIVALKAGKIEIQNPVLILENLDRFSRLPPRVAYTKLAESSSWDWMSLRWKMGKSTPKND